MSVQDSELRERPKVKSSMKYFTTKPPLDLGKDRLMLESTDLNTKVVNVYLTDPKMKIQSQEKTPALKSVLITVKNSPLHEAKFVPS
jgi:hypothetical protein